MDFDQKYELIEPLPGEGPKSFRARQSGLGRDVTVHFLVGGQTPENQAMLARLRALPPNSLARLIEVGNSADGTQYVVTIAPPFQHLVEWLKDQEAAATDAQRLTRAGMWKVPTMNPPAAVPDPVPPVEPAQPTAFEDMFRTPGPTPTGQMMAPGAHQPPAPLPASPVASEPGEFTRLFQTSAVPAAAPAPPAVANISQPSPLPAEPKPQAPAALPATPPAPPPVAAAPVAPPIESQAGEFTRLFQTPAVPTAAPAAPIPQALVALPVAPPAAPPAPPPVAAAPVPPPVESQAGEFTRLFQTPAVPTAAPVVPAPPAVANIPQPPLAPAAPKPEPPAALPAAPPAPPPAPPPVAPAPAPPPVESQPGEFTRLFQTPAVPTAPPTAPAPPAVANIPQPSPAPALRPQHPAPPPA